MPDEPAKDDPDMEEITLKRAHKDYDIPLSTLSYWVRSGHLKAQEHKDTYGQKFYKAMRRDIKALKANPPTRGRPPKKLGG